MYKYDYFRGSLNLMSILSAPMARIGSSGCLCAKDSFRRPAACRFPKVQDPGQSPVRYSLQGQALEYKLVKLRSNLRNRLWTACMFYSFQANNSNKPIASSILDQQIVVGLAQAASAKELRLNLGLHVEGHHSRIPLHALQPRSLKKCINYLLYGILEINSPAAEIAPRHSYSPFRAAT